MTQLCDGLKNAEDLVGGGRLRNGIAAATMAWTMLAHIHSGTFSNLLKNLINSLSPRRMGHLIWDLYIWCVDKSLTQTQLNILTNDLYTNMCQKWVNGINQAFTSFPDDFIVEMLTCLFWFGKLSLRQFTATICFNFPPGTDNSLGKKFFIF